MESVALRHAPPGDPGGRRHSALSGRLHLSKAQSAVARGDLQARACVGSQDRSRGRRRSTLGPFFDDLGPEDLHGLIAEY
jgi:hypothetical protein